MDSSGISFTALFTGHVWYESGMSARFFTSPKGELLYRGLAPVEYVSKRTFGFNVHDMLLQRHLIMDHLIEQHIKNEGVSQILEIASGYSPRGYTLSRKFPQLHYIEADLPHMAKRKTELLAQHKGFGPHHKVVACDVFEEQGPLALQSVLANELSPNRPTIIITEGLVNYFKLKHISEFWQKLAELGQVFPKAWYLTDLVPQPKKGLLPLLMKTATETLSIATRANVNLHFRSTNQIQEAFKSYGFNQVQVHHPKSFKDTLNLPIPHNKSIVRVIEAQIHQ